MAKKTKIRGREITTHSNTNNRSSVTAAPAAAVTVEDLDVVMASSSGPVEASCEPVLPNSSANRYNSNVSRKCDWNSNNSKRTTQAKRISKCEPTESMTSVFSLETSGKGANLSRAVRVQLQKRSKGFGLFLSENHIRQIEKTQRLLPAIQRSLEKEKKRRDLLSNEICDIWGDVKKDDLLSLSQRGKAEATTGGGVAGGAVVGGGGVAGGVGADYKKLQKRQQTLQQSKINKALKAPAVKLPLGGDSINPDNEEHQKIVSSAVAVELEIRRKRRLFEQSFYPITHALFEILPVSLVQSLTSLQKQRVFAYYNHLKASQSNENDSVDKKLNQWLKLEFDIDVDQFSSSSGPGNSTAPGDCTVPGAPADNSTDGGDGAVDFDGGPLLGFQVTNSVYIEDSETEDDEQEQQQHSDPQQEQQQVTDEAAAKKQSERSRLWAIKAKVKTRADRNRYKRHLELLKQSSAKKEHVKFINSVDRVKEYLAEIKMREEQQKARAAYKAAVSAAKEESISSRGIVGTLKLGKYSFKEAPPELILPSTIAEACGSLRKSKLSQVSGFAIRDRASSFYRRGLLEPAKLMTPSELFKVRRQLHWNKKARRVVVKIRQ